MNLTHDELQVVNEATRANITMPAAERADDYRTFHGIDGRGLDALLTEHAEFLGNEAVSRLPTPDVFQQFLTDYPFFRVHGFLHNLTVEDPLELFITGIEYAPASTDALAHFDADSVQELKRRFTEEFYTADILHISDGEFAAEYHLDRLFEMV